eukprot:gene8619-11051_t
MESQILALQNERTIVQRDILSYKSEIEMSHNRVEDTEKELGKRNAQIEQLKKQFDTSRLDFEAQISRFSENEVKLKAEVKRQEQVNNENVEKIALYESSVNKLKQDYSAVKKSESEARNELRTLLDQQIPSLQTEIKRLQNQLRDEQGKSAESVSLMESQILALQNERTIVQRDILSYKSEIELLLNRVEGTDKELGQRNSQIEQLKKQFDASRLDFEAQISRFSENEVKLKADVKRQEQVNNENVEKITIFESSVNKLKQDYSAVKKSESEARNELRTLLDQQIPSLQTEIKRLQNQLRDEQGKSAESVSLMESQILALQNERTIVQRDILSYKSEIELLHNRVEGAEKELGQRNAQIEQLKKQFDTSRLDFEAQISRFSENEVKLKADVKRLEQVNNENVEKIALYESSVSKLKQDYSVVKKSESEARNELRALLDQQIPSLQTEIKRLQNQLRDEQGKSAESVSLMESQILALQNERTIVQRDILSYKSEIELLHNRVEGADKELGQRNAQIEQLKRQLESIRLDLEAQISRLSDNEVKLKADMKRQEQVNNENVEKIALYESSENKLKQDYSAVKKSESEARN